MEKQKDTGETVLREVLKDLLRESELLKKSCRVPLKAEATVALSAEANRKALARMIIAELQKKYPRKKELAQAAKQLSFSCKPGVALDAFLEFKVPDKQPRQT